METIFNILATIAVFIVVAGCILLSLGEIWNEEEKDCFGFRKDSSGRPDQRNNG